METNAASYKSNLMPKKSERMKPLLPLILDIPLNHQKNASNF